MLARGEVHTEFLWGKLRERDHVEDLGVDGRIILRRMFRKWGGDMYCIDLAQDGERWWADVNTVTNIVKVSFYQQMHLLLIT